ncbi:MAG: hypothetical protein J1F65_03375 [Clostridiales bacterium]|nr:hypothetical protein [Clostridiales bacterium]
MQYFQYGSRIVENERIIGLESKVRKVGNMLHAVVEFFVAVILFTALNTILHNLAHETGLFSFSTYRILLEGANIVASNDTLTFISYLYDHMYCIVFALTFGCVCAVVYMISVYYSDEAERVHSTSNYVRNDFSQSAVDAHDVPSYRHKICFLA